MEFMSAPFVVPGEDDTARSWWFTKDHSFSSRDEPDTCIGLEESVRLVEETWRTAGPFDGLLGFSQGACLVSLLSAMCETGQTSFRPRFVVLVSGFKSRCKAHEILYPERINVPSLHVIGETDAVIPSEWSEALTQTFVNPTVLRHPGGHFVPGNSSLKVEYLLFFQQLK